jgi:hypothetical protein
MNEMKIIERKYYAAHIPKQDFSCLISSSEKSKFTTIKNIQFATSLQLNFNVAYGELKKKLFHENPICIQSVHAHHQHCSKCIHIYISFVLRTGRDAEGWRRRRRKRMQWKRVFQWEVQKKNLKYYSKLYYFRLCA